MIIDTFLVWLFVIFVSLLLYVLTGVVTVSFFNLFFYEKSREVFSSDKALLVSVLVWPMFVPYMLVQTYKNAHIQLPTLWPTVKEVCSKLFGENK